MEGPMDDPVPIRRAAVGCLVIALAGLALALIVRPAIFSLAPARDDSAVVVATAAEVADGPVQREVLLTRSYGWPGERDAGEGRTQLSVIVAPGPFAGVTAVVASSPVADGCPLEVSAIGLTDCDGNAWTLDGVALETQLPPLPRFPVEVVAGSVTVDFTRTLTDTP
jgi:hypothetical protein